MTAPPPTSRGWFVPAALLSLLLVVSCGRDESVAPTTPSAAAAARSSPSGSPPAAESTPTQAAPAQVTLKYATKFSVTYSPSYKLVTVHEPFTPGIDEHYVLVRRGTKAPDLTSDLARAVVVEIPIRSMFSGSTTHLPLLADLGRLDVLTGVANASYPSNPDVRARISTGEIVEYAPNSEVDVELVVSKAPSTVMSGGSDSEMHQSIRDAGVPVVANAEWLESSALGRAEWIKYMSLFLDEEAKATQVFDRIEAAYEALAAQVRLIPEARRPKVMTGQLYNGVFYATGGRSYVAELIRDAGGLNVWNDNQDSGSLKLDLETQLDRAGDADIWINGSGSWTSLAAMVQEEPRFAEFKAVREGQVWLQNKSLNASGGNEYWERGVTRPDLVLADLVKIFHPDLARDHEFEWYRQVPAQ